MSYDISILSRSPGVSIGKSELARQLAEAGWRADSSNHFLFEGREGASADMDLAWAQQGAYLEPGDKVNCLQIHIPYGFVESSLAEVLQQCHQIADALGWQVYDEQEGTHLR